MNSAPLSTSRPPTNWKVRSGVGNVIKHVVLVFFGVFYILPLFWMLTTALKTDRQIIEYNSPWIPDPWVWQNFPDAFRFVPFDIYLQNSLLVAFLSVIGALISSTLRSRDQFMTCLVP